MVSGSVIDRGLTMKTYAQFYTMSTGYIDGTIPPKFSESHKRLIEACGDRAIIQIDSRLSPKTIGEIAARECKARKYLAWEILRGDSLLSAKPVSQVNRVTYGRDDTTAMSATHGA
jgi:hypothetical protein